MFLVFEKLPSSYESFLIVYTADRLGLFGSQSVHFGTGFQLDFFSLFFGKCTTKHPRLIGDGRKQEVIDLS